MTVMMVLFKQLQMLVIVTSDQVLLKLVINHIVRVVLICTSMYILCYNMFFQDMTKKS